MNLLSHKPRTREAAAIRDRIFNVLPAASYQMEKLFGLLDIDFSDAIPTACVECSMTPRLLLNKEFVEEYCSSDGDLFLLILHELHHVILGHTRLFPRGTGGPERRREALHLDEFLRQFPVPPFEASSGMARPVS